MRKVHLPFLVCPKTKRPLDLNVLRSDATDSIKDGVLIEPVSGNKYSITDHIPRFVPAENYAKNFGFQWNQHWQTQSDEYTKAGVSANRFLKETRWRQNLEGEFVLEVGCGAGRFTTHAISTKATVISFDYSNAVDANYRMNGKAENLLLVQADIYNMPFKEEFFDKAFCFGVLQHTPDPEQAFKEIVERLKPGGKIASDVYQRSWKNLFHIKPYIRPFVKRMAPESLYEFTRKYVDFIWPLARIARRNKYTRKLISRFVAERSEQLGAVNDDLIREWAYLDTFDWFSPAFDKPQSLKTFRSWHVNAQLTDIDVHCGFNSIEGRATKPIGR